MTSEFDQLSEKISLLAELTQTLRRENADLRLQVASLSSENQHMEQKMREAKERVFALIEAIPAPDNKEIDG